MKNIRKLLLCLTCLILLCGCEIYIYNPTTDNTNESSKDDTTEDTDNKTDESPIIITQNSNYSGNVTITDKQPTEKKSWVEVYDAVKSSVVTIRNIQDDKIDSTGSGVFFSEDATSTGFAYLFTNAHVVKKANSIEVLLSNGILVKGELVGYDTNEDVAIVRIAKRKDYSIATLRDSSSLKIGEEVLAVGSPLGEKYSDTATSGIISNLNVPQTEESSSVNLYLIQIDAALNPGNSGGPLFDNAGNLIGINTLKLVNSGSNSNIESFNYSIPISHFHHVAKSLINNKEYSRPFLNIKIIDVRYLTFKQREEYGLNVDHGLLLLEINELSPLYSKASLYQVITHIEGVKIIKDSDFSVKLLQYYPDDTISLTICNPDGSESTEIDVKLLKR